MNWNMIKKGLNNPVKAIKYMYGKSLHRYRDTCIRYTSKRPIGTQLYELDWDLMIILDSCRYDILSRVQHEYDFLQELTSIWSVGGTSPEWLANTFNKKYLDQISDTAYITANPHSKTILEDQLSGKFRRDSTDIIRMRKWRENYNIAESSELEYYLPVWKNQDVGQDKFYDLFGPLNLVTDEAIRMDREQDIGKIILHYMPPHRPYIIDAKREGRELRQYERYPFQYIKETGDKETVMESCTNMARWVLDDVRKILNNVDRDNVIITADHGDGFGEFGTYNHHAGSLHPKIRRVPLVQTSASDKGTYDPVNQYQEGDDISNIQKEQLEALGYI